MDIIKAVKIVEKLKTTSDLYVRSRYGESSKKLDFLKVCILPVNKRIPFIISWQENEWEAGYYVSLKNGFNKKGEISYKEILGNWEIFYREGLNKNYYQLTEVLTSNSKIIWENIVK